MKIYLIGMPGSGKTSLGFRLANILGYKFYDTDWCIEKTYKKKIYEIFVNGENYFRELETETLKSLSLMNKKAVISTGGGIVERIQNKSIMKNTGIVIYLERDIDEILKFASAKNRPLLKHDRKKVLKELYENRNEKYIDFSDFQVKIKNSLFLTANYIKNELKRQGHKL